MVRNPPDDLDLLETQLTNMLLMPRPIREGIASILSVLKSQRLRLEVLEYQLENLELAVQQSRAAVRMLAA